MPTTSNNSVSLVCHLLLNCHTCSFLSSLCLSSAWHSASPIEYGIVSQGGHCAEYLIWSPDSRFFLDIICLSRSHHHLDCCGLRLLTSPPFALPFDCVDNSCLTTGESQLDLQWVIPTHKPWSLSPPAKHFWLKITFLLAVLCLVDDTNVTMDEKQDSLVDYHHILNVTRPVRKANKQCCG